jgi:peptidoglycan hydrolase-like protein with peptidoglycan-binding domain
LATPPPKQPDLITAIFVQKVLLRRGFKEFGAPDGLVGPSTTAAIIRFRQKNGLGGGLIDKELLSP